MITTHNLIKHVLTADYRAFSCCLNLTSTIKNSKDILDELWDKTVLYNLKTYWRNVQPKIVWKQHVYIFTFIL